MMAAVAVRKTTETSATGADCDRASKEVIDFSAAMSALSWTMTEAHHNQQLCDRLG